MVASDLIWMILTSGFNLAKRRLFQTIIPYSGWRLGKEVEIKNGPLLKKR
jgi:hypothetical protein